MGRNQLNVRVTPQIEAVIDAKRIELAKTLGTIPTRSDVVRLALESYLGVRFDEVAVTERSSVTNKARTSRRRR